MEEIMIFWMVLLILCIGIEVLTLGLTTIWFAAGALVAIFAALLQAPIFIQVILFLVVSLLSLFFTRPIAVKYFNRDRVKIPVGTVVVVAAISGVKLIVRAEQQVAGNTQTQADQDPYESGIAPSSEGQAAGKDETPVPKAADEDEAEHKAGNDGAAERGSMDGDTAGQKAAEDAAARWMDMDDDTAEHKAVEDGPAE